MIAVLLQFAPWGKPQLITRLAGGREIGPNDFKKGDMLLVRTELGTDLGQVVEVKEIEEESGLGGGEPSSVKTVDSCRPKPMASDKDKKEKGDIRSKSKKAKEPARFILRKANAQDLEKQAKSKKQKKEVVKSCEELVRKHKLPIKLVDAYFSYDGGRVTFAFIAPEKVDFRNLVKDLSSRFHKSVRLHQVGVRKEVGRAGDIGPCGRSLCCLKFLKNLGNVSTKLIFDQQLAHRGSERLSGVCGRLKCCLAFEEENYKELAKNLPAVGTLVATPRGKGKVVDWHILKQTVNVEIGKDVVVEVPLSEIQNAKIKMQNEK